MKVVLYGDDNIVDEIYENVLDPVLNDDDSVTGHFPDPEAGGFPAPTTVWHDNIVILADTAVVAVDDDITPHLVGYDPEPWEAPLRKLKRAVMKLRTEMDQAKTIIQDHEARIASLEAQLP